MAFGEISAGEALADIGLFNLQILQGVMRTYVSTNAQIMRHNLDALQALFPEPQSRPSAEPLEHLTRLGLLIAPVAMPGFTTVSRGAAVTYWRRSAEGKLELNVGTALGGEVSIAIGSETARQQSDSWGCEITWQPGDVKQFLQAFESLKDSVPQFQDRLSELLAGGAGEPNG